ncbi:MAG: T9SS type A sorting domain-containing protein [Saprospiraceae bacterium]|nr:T9SS type A sorting domain-containing protein [Saprospiraceae bacterium]
MKRLKIYVHLLSLLCLLLCSIPLSAQNTIITGRIFADFDQNCLFSAGDVDSYNGIAVTATDVFSGQVYYGSYDASVNFQYEISNIPVSTYLVEVHPNTPYLVLDCTVADTLTFSAQDSSFVVDFPLRPVATGAFLETSISTPFVNQCGYSLYTLNYRNQGTTIIDSAYIDVTFDSYMVFDSSSLPFINLGGNQYRFFLQNSLGLGEEGYTAIGTYIDCNTDIPFLGRAHTIRAEAFPDTLPAILNTTTSLLEARAECVGDSVMFLIHNKGIAPNPPTLPYIITHDDLLLRMGNPSIIPPGGTDTIYEPVDTLETYRITIEQENVVYNYLQDGKPSAFAEGCVPDTLNIQSVGFGTMYDNGGSRFNQAIDVQQNINTIDPTQVVGITAYPTGYDPPNNYIESNTPIDYHIWVHNTTGSAVNGVTIYDSLSPLLDLTKIEFIGGSHETSMELTEEGFLVLRFLEPLQSSIQNQYDLSYGFVKIRIHQQADNPQGSLIANHVNVSMGGQIYTSNQVIQQIASDFIIVKQDKIYIPEMEVKTYPNPFKYSTTVELLGVDCDTLDFYLYDAMGRIVRHQQVRGQDRFEVERGNLESGIYFYRIDTDGRVATNGKLIVQ